MLNAKQKRGRPIPNNDTLLPPYWSRCANERDSNYYPVRIPNWRSRSDEVCIYYIGSNLYDDVPRKNVIDWEKGKDEGYENTSNQAVIVALDALAQEDEESEAEQAPARKKSRGLRKKGQKQQSTASHVDTNEKNEDYSEEGDASSSDIDSDDERYQDVSYYPDKWLVDDTGAYDSEEEEESRKKAHKRRSVLDVDEEEEEPIILPRPIEMLLESDPSKPRQEAYGYLHNQALALQIAGMDQTLWHFYTCSSTNFSCIDVPAVKSKCAACRLTRWCNKRISARCPRDRTKSVSMVIGPECCKRITMARDLYGFWYANIPMPVSDPKEWTELSDKYAEVLDGALNYKWQRNTD